jgi:NodT family efflux transporter outer membrane factor (OMF) lipoprotein
MRSFTPIFILIVFLLQGCALYTPEPRSPLPDNFPSRYTLYTEEGGEGSGRWWEEFGSPELDRLVGKALGDNFTIRKAWARLGQADAVAAGRSSGLWPNVAGDAGASRTKNRTEGFGRSTDTSYSLGLSASYEVDLWGRIDALVTAGDMAAEATRADMDAAAMSVAAGVAETWIDLIATRREIRLLGEQVETNTTLLSLQQLRFEKSLASALDVLQQAEVLERAMAQIPPLEAQEKSLEYALALLVGEPPGVPLEISQTAFPPLAPLPDTGLPADLLAARPDVRAAGLRLKAADWEISAARADRLPALSLTGSGSYAGDRVDRLFDNWMLGLAAGLTGPIFDGGRRAAEVRRTRAVAAERLAAYQETVFTALGEVEENLINEKKEREHIRALEKVLDTARRALEEAEIRYTRGLNNFIPLLTELLSVQGQERELVRRRAALLKHRIGLHRALGGGWTDRMTPRGLATGGSGPSPRG